MIPLKIKNSHFSNKTIRVIFSLSILLFLIFSLHGQVRIKMKKENGVYTTPCKVNGLKLRFIFDTGASNVSLSLTEATFMLKNGYLDETDLHGSSYSQIANGDIIENTSVTLKEIEIGGLKLYNIEAIIIHELTAPLLLGQSVIRELGKIQIDDDILVIINANTPSATHACDKAKQLLINANKYFEDNLYALSAETFQTAYDFCPNSMSCLDLNSLGLSYKRSDNNDLAIKYLNISAKCLPSEGLTMYTYYFIGDCYLELNKYLDAIIYYQKALSLAKDDENISSFNSSIGTVYHKQKKYNEALEYYKKALDYYLEAFSYTNTNIMSGNITNVVLGELYWNVASCYYLLDFESKSNNYMIRSALCGFEDAISFCNKYELDYRSFIE
jgi:clan AA aspartic protease (TIGR02281 family)